MLIDWFTVGAQTVNFIVLVWLMKRFLYQPILNAIDARERKIADELARADKVSDEANQAKARYANKNLEIEQQRDQLMADAIEAANAERQRLLEETRQMAEQLEIKQKTTLQNRLQELQLSIRTAAQKELFSMAKNALRDLAVVDIESQMVAVFLNQLSNIDSEQKIALQIALKENQISVVSSNALTADQQSSIEKTLIEVLGEGIHFKFEQSIDLIGGIELTTKGFKIGWSVAEYLYSLEDSLSEYLVNQINTRPVNEQTPLNASTDTTATQTRLIPSPEQKTGSTTQ